MKTEKYEGNLIIRTQADAEKYKNLAEVTGYLSSSCVRDLHEAEQVYEFNRDMRTKELKP